jgi:lincosamide nucleotidyltransferase A/C/D/E
MNTRMLSRPVSGSLVLAVLHALSGVGVEGSLAGGWGVDALLGRRTRRHHDVDVLVDTAEPDLRDRCTQALQGLGFRLTRTMTSIEPMPVVWIFRDHGRRHVELLPVDKKQWPPDAFTSGTVNGERVSCISAPIQLSLRRGYRTRAHDRKDVRQLCAAFHLPPPEGF